ncbi:hypothetical protein RAS12_02020 [Achromobacter seleniivolatilans]|uniref:Uncharacterized protein n=1 Tax=Achromobacter seleniivolatilans TaxID=3047478 RepID=A0ABY9M2D5_9BURK|nr:hypothetical protein [Achromobacter sp. R39]WMD21166.1 hypothetical protein RAS12_02020 [Achromobacter sp. R39]
MPINIAIPVLTIKRRRIDFIPKRVLFNDLIEAARVGPESGAPGGIVTRQLFP